MCANPQSNWLHTIAVRASCMLPILRRFPWRKPRKTEGGGGGLSIFLWKKPNRNHFVFLSFGVGPLNWQSFIEIGEMACSKTARCSRGHTIKTFLSFKYKQSRETKLSRCKMDELFMFIDQECELHDILTKAQNTCKIPLHSLSVIISRTYKRYYFRIELCFLSYCM